MMDPHFKINLQGRDATSAYPLYLLPVNPAVATDSQAIPLHILDNNIDGWNYPFLQQKHGQPLLLIETLQESTKPQYVYHKKEEDAPNALLKSSMPISILNIENCDINLTNSHKQIQNSGKEYIQTVTFTSSSPSYHENKDISENTLEKTEKGVNNFQKDVNTEKIFCPKQKIKNYVHISDVKAPPRAIAVLPAALQIRGNWISPRRTLSARVRFGPVQGIRKTITRSEAQILLLNSKTPVFLLQLDEDYVIHIDVSDKDKSNWIGLLPLGDQTTQTTQTSANVWLYEESNELYCLTTQPIGARKPLRLGYSKKYVEEHNIPHGPCPVPVLDLETVNPVQWWCNECNRGMQSAAVLERHTEVYHKDDLRPSRSSYRCRYCKRPFGRLFTLKRHMLSHCLKKPQNSPEKIQKPTETNQMNEPDISSVLEDNRIPSDESFQNFTNSLDFSTNLFDTDRIAGLDISGNSRADSDLNSYSMGFRDENGLSNDLGFTKLSNTLENVQNNEINQEQEELAIDMCAFCNQVVKESKTKHLRQCPSRLICECGRVFRYKKSLTRHIRKCHPGMARQEKPEKKTTEQNEQNMAYKCQECPLGFKRRGMLVNHLWRVHKMISTTPVEKKVRHYPCTACSKIYRSANKRDRHVRAHHPGLEKPLGQWIEGGVKRCQPASCSACPRQYASRAKLLQHVRQQHPHLAKIMKNQAIEKQSSTTENQSNATTDTPPPEGINYTTHSSHMLSWKTD